MSKTVVVDGERLTVYRPGHTQEENDRDDLTRILDNQSTDWVLKEVLEMEGAGQGIVEFVQCVVDAIEGHDTFTYFGIEEILKGLAKLTQPQGYNAAELFLAEAYYNITGRRV